MIVIVRSLKRRAWDGAEVAALQLAVDNLAQIVVEHQDGLPVQGFPGTTQTASPTFMSGRANSQRI